MSSSVSFVRAKNKVSVLQPDSRTPAGMWGVGSRQRATGCWFKCRNAPGFPSSETEDHLRGDVLFGLQNFDEWISVGCHSCLSCCFYSVTSKWLNELSKLHKFISTTSEQCYSIVFVALRSPYLNGKIREVVSDCALPISVVIFSFIGSYFFLDIQRKFTPPRWKSSWEAPSHVLHTKNCWKKVENVLQAKLEKTVLIDSGQNLTDRVERSQSGEGFLSAISSSVIVLFFSVVVAVAFFL